MRSNIRLIAFKSMPLANAAYDKIRKFSRFYFFFGYHYKGGNIQAGRACQETDHRRNVQNEIERYFMTSESTIESILLVST